MNKSQSGSSTLLSILVILLLTIMGIGLLNMITNETRVATSSRDVLEAEYAAEAGAKRAVNGFLIQASDWTWLGSDKAFVNDVTTKKYNVRVSPNTPVFTGTGTSVYIIQSTGIVGRATKNVSVSVSVTNNGAGNNVFSKYTLFSGGNLQIDNTPTIKGDIGSNGTITVNSSTPLINGTAYTSNVPVMDQWTWNKNAVTGGYQYANPAGTLDVNSLIPAMPNITESGTNLAKVSGSTLSGGSYYYDGNFTTGSTFTAASGQAVTIYINGNLQLTQQSGTNGSIIGDNVTIYVTGSITMDNNSSIQANNLKIYAGSDIQLTNYAAVNGSNTTIQTNGNINFNSNSSINKNSTTAVTKIYANGNVQLTNQFEMDGSAGLVVTKSYVNVNSSAAGNKIVFVAGSGSSQVTNSGKIAAIYTNGTLNINSSPQINNSNQLSSVIQTLGLSGGSPTIQVSPGSWTTH